MRWLKRLNKWMVGGVIASFAMAGTASAAFMPGGIPGLGGGNGGTFYDFESVFSESGGGIGGLFGDLFSGIDGLGIVDDLLGKGGGSFVSDCGVVIMNIAPSDGDCGESGPLVFDSVFDGVAGELGIPEDIAGVVTGRTSLDSIFESVLNEQLTQLGIPGVGDGSENSVIGQQGIPDPNGVLDELMRASRKQSLGLDLPPGVLPDSNTTGSQIAGNVLTPGVNSSLAQPLVALGLLTDAVTSKGLSTDGQQVSKARITAAQAATRTSGMIGQQATEVAQHQLEAAVEMDTTIKEQTSTQDALKEAMSGMNLLQAQSSELMAQSITQQALSTQIEGMNLQIDQEMRDGVFSNGLSLEALNDQALAASQRQMAEKSSLVYESRLGMNLMGAWR